MTESIRLPKELWQGILLINLSIEIPNIVGGILFGYFLWLHYFIVCSIVVATVWFFEPFLDYLRKRWFRK